MIQPDKPLLDALLGNEDPCLRYWARTKVLGQEPDSAELAALRAEIRLCPRVQNLLSERLPDGRIPWHPYFKWRGAHWVLAQLADLGYPAGDESLLPLREQVLGWLLGQKHARHIKMIDGRVRRCASQESNAFLSLLRLGLADERCYELAHRLVSWQWPDGGWNCDVRPQANHSSFHESWIPMRALWAYAEACGSQPARQAALRAAEHFLAHRLFRRLRDGEPYNREFMRLGYPSYWHYDLLSALTGMAELGLLDRPECQEALDLLESCWLDGGGFPAQRRYYRVSKGMTSGASLVGWGAVSVLKMNPWVTCLALGILRQAGRLQQ